MLLDTVDFGLFFFDFVKDLLVFAFEHKDDFLVFGLFLFVLGFDEFDFFLYFSGLILEFSQLFIFIDEGVFSLLEKRFIFLFLEIEGSKLFFSLELLVDIALFLGNELKKAPDSELIIFGVVQSTDLHPPRLESPDDEHPAGMEGLFIGRAGDLSLCRRVVGGAFAQ